MDESMTPLDILFVNCCISAGRVSRTGRLARACMDWLEKSHSCIREREESLITCPCAPLTRETLQARNILLEKGDTASALFDPARRFAAAGVVVIAAPYWDLSFPAELKAYIEQIMVNTITFTYEENRPRGLCRAERLVYVTTAGGYVGDNDFGYTYIRAIGEMLGIPRCVRVCAEGLDIQGNDGEALLAEAIAGVPAALAE